MRAEVIATPQDTARAKIVREALTALQMSPESTMDEYFALGRLLRCATDSTLARLGRMLR